MDKHIASIHRLDENATPSKEKWLTQCGVFKTTSRLVLEQMKLPQFSTKRTVTAEMNLFERAKEDPYDFILGRNFLQDIKLDIKNSTRTFHWDEIEIPMVPRGHWNKTSIGTCLIQKKESEFPIGYFARKFNSAQRKYTVTEKELLSIVEGLKHFRTIVYGHRITAHTDHKNLTYDNSDYSSDRILRQRLVIEEYGTEIKYIPGIKKYRSRRAVKNSYASTIGTRIFC